MNLVIKIAELPKICIPKELEGLSKDQEEMLSLFELIKDCHSYDLSFCPNVSSSLDSDVYSYFECTLSGDFRIRIHFTNGMYDFWTYENLIIHKISLNKDSSSKETALDEIASVLNHYKTYESSKYRMFDFVDTFRIVKSDI